MQILDPITERDFRRGRISKNVVAQSLVPENSVAESLNVVFDEQIGGARVRKGTTIFANLVYNRGQNQSNLTGASTTAHVFTPNDYAQTYTVIQGEQIAIGFSVKLYRVGSPGLIVLTLRSTVAGVPDAIIATGYYDGNTVTTGVGGTFYDIQIPPQFLNGGDTYAFALACPTGDVANYIVWLKDVAGTFPGGAAYSSGDSGVTWSAIAANDFQFKVYHGVTGYNEEPLGFFIGLFDGTVQKAVAYFVSPSVGGTKTYYYTTTINEWRIANTPDLDDDARNRIAILNDRIFRANGVDAMTSSEDLATWTTDDCITTDGVIPALLFVYKNTMLASGDADFRSRIYFSSLVAPNSNPFITWDTDPDDGDWIDVNPDDGGVITGFSSASGFVIVFKNNAMYRTDVINKIVDLDNVYNVGATSQEAIVKCLGLTYFYSGVSVYRTEGGFPEEISRMGISDFLEQVTNPDDVFLETDGLNVYVSMEDITVNNINYMNLTLKFSPRDESWSVHTYQQRFGVSQLLSDPNQDLVSVPLIQTWNGKITQINSGVGDDKGNIDLANMVAVPYFLETQEKEMGNRAHTKQISDKVVVYTKEGGESQLLIKQDDKDFKTADIQLTRRVNVGANNINYIAHFFTFRWQGSTSTMRPLLEGYHLPKVTDMGVSDEPDPD